MINKEKQTDRTDNFEELSDTVSIPNKEKTISVSKFEDIKLTIPFKKEVEEMAKSCKNCIHNAVCDKKIDLKYYFDNHDCEHYQPKLPKDSVILSREEQDKLYQKGFDDGKEFAENFYKPLVKAETSKETAEKCRNFVKEWVGNDEEGLGFLFDFEDFITKQFGVEIKE